MAGDRQVMSGFQPGWRDNRYDRKTRQQQSGGGGLQEGKRTHMAQQATMIARVMGFAGQQEGTGLIPEDQAEEGDNCEHPAPAVVPC